MLERIDGQQLALIRELADRGSLTAVAAALHKTPSAVSQQLKALQQLVGVPLVERVGRGIQVTRPGTRWPPGRCTSRPPRRRRRRSGSASAATRPGPYASRSSSPPPSCCCPGLLDRLRAHPGIGLETYDEDVSQDDFPGLTVDYDIVVAHRSDDVQPARRGGLAVTRLMREPLDVALPLGHPLAGRAYVTPADVIGDDWIGPPPGFPVDRVLTAMSVTAGSPVRVVRRTTHFPLTERLVAAGHGIALLPRHTTTQHAAGRFALVPLRALRAGRLVEALSRPDRAARRAVTVVLTELRAEAAAYAP